MHRAVSRREFLQASARSSMTLALAPLVFADTLAIPPPARLKKVAVVGAGIAGLVAAFELMQSGHDITVFEARTRPGGRVFTMRDHFSDGLYAEGGAFDFGDAYTILLRYIKMFDLQFNAESDSPVQYVYYLQNQRSVVPPGTEPNWPFPLTPEERKLGLQGLWNKYVLPATAAAGKPLEGDWPNPVARDLDKITINQLLRRQGASDGVISLLRFNFLGDDFDHVSSLQDIGWSEFFARNRGGKTLKGGNDQLPKAFAARLGPRIHYGAALQKLSQDKTRVRLSLSRAGAIEQVEADYAILAIPFSTLRQVELDNSFTAEKREVISKLRYESITRVYLQSASRFWDQQKLAGYAATDLPVRTIGEFTTGQPGMRAILGTETIGPNAHMAAMMTPDQRVRWCLENINKVFPEMRQNFEGGTSVAWETEPWSLGANAYFAPGEMTTMLPHVANPEGRVHFAGEHTSNYFVMEGAAQSGVRAAREINAAVGSEAKVRTEASQSLNSGSVPNSATNFF